MGWEAVSELTYIEAGYLYTQHPEWSRALAAVMEQPPAFTGPDGPEWRLQVSTRRGFLVFDGVISLDGPFVRARVLNPPQLADA